jgi:mannan endo-1,4-beta-mannosidase
MKTVGKAAWFLFMVLLVASMVFPARPVQAASGFHISGRNLLDANGNNFIMRGISHAHVWYPSETSSFANIKAAGANTVRVVLGGGRWGPSSATDVANVIQLCKTNKLICVLENHDTTGFGEDGAATSLAQAVNYWKSIQSVLTGQEAYVIINLGNEPYGNTNASAWVEATRSAIIAMRDAGFDHTLMVDAPNWGQDWEFVMRDNAASIFNSDVDKNTIFSIHMYGVFDTAAEIQDYVASFVTAGLPLVIGEFGWNHSDGNPDEDAIMATAQSNGIGYLGWSWSGNGGGVEYLDMVTGFNPSQRTSWGTRIITGANGLQQTSVEASVYGNGATNTPVSATQIITPALNPNTAYYWRVQAVGKKNADPLVIWSSSWSAARYFRTAYTAPVLTLPGNGDNLTDLRPTFDWDDVPNATGYTIQVSRNNIFTSLVLTGSSATSTFTPAASLPPNVPLFWRVMATGAYGPSTPSLVYSFQSANPPSIPVLTLPALNVLTTDYTPTLKWATVTIPAGTTFDHYQVQVNTSAGFGPGTMVMDDTSLTSAASIQIDTPALDSNKTFYWRLRAVGKKTSDPTVTWFSGWSAARYFRTGFTPPVLTVPVNATAVTTLRPLFDWDDVTSATSYTIQVSTSPTFATSLANATITLSTYTPTISLPSGYVIFWRVRANGANGPSDWSPTILFTTP